MSKPCSRHQEEILFFLRAKTQQRFRSIKSVLIFWRAVSVQALDNVLFDGVQWLTRPHLSPRPLLLSSPHAPCRTKCYRHPPTDSHTHSQKRTLPHSASFLWRILAVVYVIELVITLQLEHHQPQREREWVLPLSQERTRKSKKILESKEEQRKDFLKYIWNVLALHFLGSYMLFTSFFFFFYKHKTAWTYSLDYL